MNEATQRILEPFSPETLAALQLSLVPHVGPQTQGLLLRHFGAAENVLAAAPSALREVAGIGPALASSIARARETIDVQAEIARCTEHQIDIVPAGDDRYPINLREIPDPPAVLFVQGNLVPHDMLAVAIVGTRHATHYGVRQATRLASALARTGLTVVSGLARGVDAAAHRGALDAGGRTIAVLPAGLTNVYPVEHQELAWEISHQGYLVSESPSLTPVSRGAFPRRNRLITGLCLGTVIVEAGDRSGALVSARHAMEQGREVFAVPGPVDSRVSHGCHRLIRDGAKLVETVDDVLEELGPLIEATTSARGESVHHPAELQLNEQEQFVLRHIQPTATPVDQIVVETGLPASRVLATLTSLEMRRLIRRLSGNHVVRL